MNNVEWTRELICSWSNEPAVMTDSDCARPRHPARSTLNGRRFVPIESIGRCFVCSPSRLSSLEALKWQLVSGRSTSILELVQYPPPLSSPCHRDRVCHPTSVVDNRSVFSLLLSSIAAQPRRCRSSSSASFVTVSNHVPRLSASSLISHLRSEYHASPHRHPKHGRISSRCKYSYPQPESRISRRYMRNAKPVVPFVLRLQSPAPSSSVGFSVLRRPFAPHLVYQQALTWLGTL
jgi:hypothetical protein